MGLSKKAPVIAKQPNRTKVAVLVRPMPDPRNQNRVFIPVMAGNAPHFTFSALLNSPLATNKSMIDSRFNGPGSTGRNGTVNLRMSS